MPDLVEVHGHVAEVADLPAAEFEGKLFWVDGTDPGLYRDNGTGWDRVSETGGGGGGGGAAYHIPLQSTLVTTPPSSWFQFNGSGTTADQTDNGRWIHRAPSGTAGIKGTACDKPSGTSYTIEMAIVPHLIANDGMGSGVSIMESSTGQLFQELYFDATDGWCIRTGTSTGYTSSPTIVDTIKLGFCPPLIFFRWATTDSVNFTCSFSFDGRFYTPMPTALVTTGVITSVLNQGFYFRVPTASSPTGVRVGVTLVHFLNS